MLQFSGGNIICCCDKYENGKNQLDVLYADASAWYGGCLAW